MKKIKPQTEYRSDRYPTAEQAGVTRRGLLHVALTGAAGLGAAALGLGLVVEDAEARRGRLRGRVARPRYRVAIDLTPDYRIKGCKSAIASVMVMSYDRQLVGYYQGKKRQKTAQRIIRKVLRRYGCADLSKYPVRRDVAKALTDHYAKKTKRRPQYTYVQLVKKEPKA